MGEAHRVNWIRVSVAIADDPRVHALAGALGVRVAEAVGLVVCLLRKFPEHAPSGSLANVSDSLLEIWAMWQGRRGGFAVAVRETFLTEQGVWAAWEKHNGAALREAAAARKRMSERRAAMGRQAELALDTATGTTAGTSAAPPPAPPSSPNGSANGSALRTNERTRTAVSARARNGHGANSSADLVPIRPHLPAVAVAPPWCEECGVGDLVPVPWQRRPVQVHLGSCSHYVAPVAPITPRLEATA